MAYKCAGCVSIKDPCITSCRLQIQTHAIAWFSRGEVQPLNAFIKMTVDYLLLLSSHHGV